MALPFGTWVGLSLQVLGGSIPSHRVIVTAEGAPYELDGSLSSALMPGPWRVAGFSQGYAVFTSVKPSGPISALTTGGRAVPVQVLSSTHQVGGDPCAGTSRRGGDPLGRLGRRLERNGVGQRGSGPDRHRAVPRSGPADPGSGRRRSGDLPLPAAPPLGGQRAQHRVRRRPPRAARRLAGRGSPAPGWPRRPEVATSPPLKCPRSRRAKATGAGDPSGPRRAGGVGAIGARARRSLSAPRSVATREERASRPSRGRGAPR